MLSRTLTKNILLLLGAFSSLNLENEFESIEIFSPIFPKNTFQKGRNPYKRFLYFLNL